MCKNLSKMSESEKDAFIEAIEIMLDYGEGNTLSDADFELYRQLTAERTKKNSSLSDVISSAEKRAKNDMKSRENEFDIADEKQYSAPIV